MAQSGAMPGIAVRDSADLPMIMKKIRACAFESQDITISQLAIWKRKMKSTKFIQSSEAVEYFRRAKSSEELRLIRKSERITIELLRRIPSVLKPGISERALAWKIEMWARELGAEAMSFDPIVAFGTHTSRPHHQPTTKKLTKGMIVQIDIGVKYRGYCSDRSVVFFTGPIPQDQERAYKAVREAKATAKKAAKRGVSVRKLDRIAREVLKKYDLEEFFTHSLGHGVGLDIHEGVSLSVRAPNEKLQKGEVITIEPGVYFPAKFGIRLEDMVIVK